MLLLIFALTLGWKIAAAAGLFLGGLLIALLIGANDMAENWNTGYGEKSNHRRKLALIIIATGIISAIIFFVVGCSHNPLTIAPTPAHAHITSDWAKRNIVDADAKGQTVHGDWVRVYKEMLKAYGDKLPVARRPASPDQGIVQTGADLYHVDWSVKDRFVLLKSYDTP